MGDTKPLANQGSSSFLDLDLQGFLPQKFSVPAPTTSSADSSVRFGSQHGLQFLRLLVSPDDTQTSSLLGKLEAGLVSEKNLKQAFQKLPQAEREILQDKIGKIPLSQILSFSQETDSAHFWENALHFGILLKRDLKEGAAISLLGMIAQGNPEIPEDVRSKAQTEYEAMVGQGSVGMRMEYLGQRLARDCRDFRTIVPMIGASLIGNVVGTSVLSRLTGTGVRGLSARALSGTVGYLAEVPTFALLNRSLAEGKSNRPFSEDLASSAMTLGAIKLAGLGGNYLFSKVSSIQTLSASAQNLLNKFQQYLLPQVNMFVGLTASHKLEEFAELRPHLDNATFFIDTLSSMVSLGVGSHLGHKVLGEGFARFQQELHLRSNIAVPAGRQEHRTSNFEHRISAIKSVGAGLRPARTRVARGRVVESSSAMVRGWAGLRPAPTKRGHIALNPLLAPMWAMLGAGGIGGSGGGSGGKKPAPDTSVPGFTETMEAIKETERRMAEGADYFGVTTRQMIEEPLDPPAGLDEMDRPPLFPEKDQDIPPSSKPPKGSGGGSIGGKVQETTSLGKPELESSLEPYAKYPGLYSNWLAAMEGDAEAAKIWDAVTRLPEKTLGQQLFELGDHLRGRAGSHAWTPDQILGGEPTFEQVRTNYERAKGEVLLKVREGLSKKAVGEGVTEIEISVAPAYPHELLQLRYQVDPIRKTIRISHDSAWALVRTISCSSNPFGVAGYHGALLFEESYPAKLEPK